MSGRGLLIVSGLDREAIRASHPARTIVVSGGSVVELQRRLQSVEAEQFSAVVSFGLAGGLDPSHSVGDALVPSAVWAAGERYPVDPVLTGAWLQRARQGTLVLTPVSGIAGVDKPVATVAAKATLRQVSNCSAADMESHVVAAYAMRHRLPFGVLRVISDPSDKSVPPAAIAALREDGGIDVSAAMRSLIRNPKQLPALIGMARAGARAFRKLSDVGLLLQVSLSSGPGD